MIIRSFRQKLLNRLALNFRQVGGGLGIPPALGGLFLDLQISRVGVPKHALQVPDFFCDHKVRVRFEEGFQSFVDQFKVNLAQLVLFNGRCSLQAHGLRLGQCAERFAKSRD